MRNKIAQKMCQTALDMGLTYLSDLARDILAINDAKHNVYPVIWQIAHTHTYLIELGDYERQFNEDMAVRFDYINNGLPYGQYLHSPDCAEDRRFLITKDEITEIDVEKARAMVRETVVKTANDWERRNGKLRIDHKVKIRFAKIGLSKLMELIRESERFGADSLLNRLKNLRRRRILTTEDYMKVTYLPSENSFRFVDMREPSVPKSYRSYGFIKWHGSPETGYIENGSKQIVPRYGWDSHS